MAQSVSELSHWHGTCVTWPRRESACPGLRFAQESTESDLDDSDLTPSWLTRSPVARGPAGPARQPGPGLPCSRPHARVVTRLGCTPNLGRAIRLTAADTVAPVRARPGRGASGWPGSESASDHHRMPPAWTGRRTLTGPGWRRGQRASRS